MFDPKKLTTTGYLACLLQTVGVSSAPPHQEVFNEVYPSSRLLPPSSFRLTSFVKQHSIVPAPPLTVMSQSCYLARILLLTLLIFSEARHYEHKRHSNEAPFVDVNDQSEYISYDEHKKPYMLCMVTTAETTVSKRCYLPEQRSKSHDMGLACYALWHGNMVVQGCWTNQMTSLKQCEKRRCPSGTSTSGIYFCCCFGHECNDSFAAEE
uniref:Activin_recp domain-containing protein n=1 Tax=Steinernema glaseri TaxID=37863 RepID=A0A1I7YUX8_9BILA